MCVFAAPHFWQAAFQNPLLSLVMVWYRRTNRHAENIRDHPEAVFRCFQSIIDIRYIYVLCATLYSWLIIKRRTCGERFIAPDQLQIWQTAEFVVVRKSMNKSIKCHVRYNSNWYIVIVVDSTKHLYQKLTFNVIRWNCIEELKHMKIGRLGSFCQPTWMYSN